MPGSLWGVCAIFGCIAAVAEARTCDLEVDLDLDQIVYEPGDAAEVSLTFSQRGVATRGTYELRQAWGLSDELVTKGSFPARESSSQSFRLSLPDDDVWGFAFEVKARQRGRTRDCAVTERRVIVVTEQIEAAAANLANLHSGSIPHPFDQTQPSRDAFLRGTFARYADLAIPIVEVSRWATSPWEGLPPAGAMQWTAAQVPATNVFAADLETMRTAASGRNMLYLAYARTYLEGPVGQAWARRHPDRVWWPDPNGAAHLAAPDLPQGLAEGRMTDRDVLEHGLEGYVDAIGRFGFDGLRWDNHPSFPYLPIQDWTYRIGAPQTTTRRFATDGALLMATDPVAVNDDIVSFTQDYLRQRHPDLVLGYNVQVISAGAPDEPVLDVPSTNATRRLMDGNIVLDEKHFDPSSGPTGMHRDWYESLDTWLRAESRVRRAGGFYYTGGHPYNGTAAYLQHAFTLAYATGARVTGAYLPREGADYNVSREVSVPWYENLLPFVQRYAKLLFDPDRQPMRTRSVTVRDDVVWERLAHTVIDGGRLWVVYGFLRPPMHCASPDDGGCPWRPLVEENVEPELRPLPIETLTVPNAAVPPRMWALSYEYDASDWRVEVPSGAFVPQGGVSANVKVELPPFRYWALLVLEYDLCDPRRAPTSTPGAAGRSVCP